MKDTQLYEQLLRLSKPWLVSRVELEIERNRITVHVECDKGVVWGDPETGQDRAHVHGWVEREWRHLDNLDTCQFETRIVAKVPRLKYKSGRVEDPAVPWAERYSRVMLMMEAFVVRPLQAASISRVAGLIKLDWHTVNDVIKRAVERGLARRAQEPVRNLGLDEKSFARGHNYASVLTDVDRSRLLEVTPGRKLEDAQRVLCSLSPEQRAGVRAHRHVARVHERGRHAAEQRGHRARQVPRLQVPQRRRGPGASGRAQAPARPGRLAADGHQIRLAQVHARQALRRGGGVSPPLSGQPADQPGMVTQGELRGLLGLPLPEVGPSLLRCLEHARHAQPHRAIKTVTKMLRRHRDGLINYTRHRITNAVAEGFSSIIQTLKANARGFRSFENFRTRILFFCGKLDFMPASVRSH